jgi:hypothetical protein
MAARSCDITVINWSAHTLTRKDMQLSHGEFSHNGKDVPPEHIAAVHLDGDGNAVPGTAHWASESDGFATGTEGTCKYTSSKGEAFAAPWNDPFVGGNDLNVSVPKGLRAEFGAISGNQMAVTITIRKRT